ncbi:futalosine hydrolase [Pedobacter sp. UYEF25]
MKALVVAATKAELNPTYTHFNLKKEAFTSSIHFDVLITGVGMVATAFALGNLPIANKYNLIVNLGIAGCFDKTVPLGTVFNVTKDSFADFGAEDNGGFLSIEQMGFGENTFSNQSTLNLGLPEALGITVNTISGNANTILDRKNRWMAQTESMEGAAVFYAAAQQKIDVVQVRSISNYVQPRDKRAWNMNLAIENLNTWAIEFLETATYL